MEPRNPSEKHGNIVTVILCTFNRATLLRRALDSLASQDITLPVRWEVLVVDNNSTDLTKQVVAEFCSRHPGTFRYVFEGRQGKSYALNTGISAAHGNILAFIDDDVSADGRWLQSLVSPLISGLATGSGGRVLAEQGFVPPRWLRANSRYALAPLAIFDLESDPGELKEAPFGTNMAFRREVFDELGNFRTDLGPNPFNEIRNEDTEFGTRVLSAGKTLWYEPAAVVYHNVPPERVKRQYFLCWWFAKGRADTRQGGVLPSARLFVAGVPLYLLRRLMVCTVRWLIEPVSPSRFYKKTRVWALWGAIRECWAARRTTGSWGVESDVRGS